MLMRNPSPSENMLLYDTHPVYYAVTPVTGKGTTLRHDDL